MRSSPHLFCSSSLASSSSSSGLRFSESAGETAGADSAASWEDESGLSTGLPVDGGSGSMPGGEDGHSSWGRAPPEPSLSGLLQSIDMAVMVEWDGGSSYGCDRRVSWSCCWSHSSVSLAVTWLATWPAVEPIRSELFKPVMDAEKSSMKTTDNRWAKKMDQSRSSRYSSVHKLCETYSNMTCLVTLNIWKITSLKKDNCWAPYDIFRT